MSAGGRRGGDPGAVLAPLGFAVGLAGGEMAFGVLVYTVAFELLGRSHDGWRRRLLALAPYAALLAVYAVARSAVGAGVSGSANYIDPTSNPTQFARAAVGRVPTLIANSVLNVPAELWGADARFRPCLVGLGLLAAAGVWWWLRKALRSAAPDEARSVRWLGAGALLALVPGAAGVMGERLLMPLSIGAAAVFAFLLRDGLRRWRETHGGGLRCRALVAAALTVLALPNLVLAAPLLVAKTILWKVIADKTREQVCQARLDGPPE